MHGYSMQFVLQGVHMILDGHLGQSWCQFDEKRSSRLVFIGENLNKTKLKKEFISCCYNPETL